MLNTAKLLILMAGLTGLLYAVCSLFNIPPIFALLFALVPNLIAYFYSDKIVLSSYGARIVTEEEAPELYRIVSRVAERANIPIPRVALINTQTPNAFATGRSPKKAVVAVTLGIMELLNEQELEGVIAHEIGHVKHRDILTGSIVATIAGAIVYMTHMLQWGLIFGGGRDNDNPGGFMGSILAIIVAPIAASIIQMAISRQNEYKADEAGALYSNPVYLANALNKLEKGVTAYPLKNGNQATAHMFIVNPFRGKDFASLFSTHPSTADRINKLMEMAGNPKYLR
ncbi:zinc metalloprotease HtpX [Methanococcus voltae]|uniref:zinc metalloprotease HtpX n=1 Tax=Methanococcus voltae TaxID=2188 RepID=UPI001AE440C1|nr:zinc metalloprotease HtpX [Methanococcus voltae]MBP2172926.1 heat shock protein HtpX [Methanococcus voltae]